MLSWDERLMIGLKALERLRPIVRTATLPDAAAPDGEAESRDSMDDTEEEDRRFDLMGSQVDFAPTTEPYQELPVATFELPSLEALIEGAGELAPYSIVLGICEDGLPFLLDLTNPAPGALLAAADEQSGKTRLLKSILASATYLNSPFEVAFYIAAQQPWQYAQLEQSDQCQGLHAVQYGNLGELIEELAQVVEERKHAGPHGPAIILALDDLHDVLQTLDEQSFSRLYWLIRHGPRSRVWTFAAYSTQRAEKIDERFLAAFRTRLVGKIGDRRLAASISGDMRLDTRHLEKGFEFCVPYGDDWTHFWTCEPESQQPSEPEEDEYE